MTEQRQAADSKGTGERYPRIAAVVCLVGKEPRAASAIETTAWADERLALNLGASEETIRECRARGGVVVDAERLPTEIARLGIDWVLLVEGYEEVPDALAREIRNTVRADGSGGEPSGYRLRRRMCFLGRTMRSRRWVAPHSVRLARMDAIDWSMYTPGVDSLPVRGHVEFLETPLLAEGRGTLWECVDRMEVLSGLMARAQHRAGVPAGWRDLIVRPTWYGLRALPSATLRDGKAGMILVVLESYCLVLACAKRWELEHPDGPSGQV